MAYSAATGAQLRVARYNGTGNRDDVASSLAVGPGGTRVYVTGDSQGPGSGFDSGYDYATVAYRAATGARLWVARYSGPGEEHSVPALAVSPGGTRVYVTGASGPDYATVAYKG